jgi:hypothetical protein
MMNWNGCERRDSFRNEVKPRRPDELGAPRGGMPGCRTQPGGASAGALDPVEADSAELHPSQHPSQLHPSQLCGPGR